ncbi:MAG: hypothetical protein LBF80_04930 [Spirochaetaceae bacterium]|jgi:hypothetical protein|nr:hypothetical protein [Spirochaetaceae bacterium]
MKNFARFLIFFGVCFPLLFVFAMGITLLHVWIDAISSVPAKTSVYMEEAAKAGCWILPFTLYLSVMFSINYGNRRRVSPPLVFFSLIILTSLFTFGASKGLNRVYNFTESPMRISHETLGQPGVVLYRFDTVITLLDNPSNRMGSRVVSIDGKPLIYQEKPIGADGKVISLPPVPFYNSERWFSRVILKDLSISGQGIAARFEEGLVPYFTWICALILLLVSLGFVTEVSRWPLANIFFGILVFRGVLTFEVFINSDEVSGSLKEFFSGALPDMFITPVIFTAITILILIYVLLLFLARITGKTQPQISGRGFR